MDRKGRRGPVVGWGHEAMCMHTDRVREKSVCDLCTTVSMVHIGREGRRKEGNSFSQAVLELAEFLSLESSLSKQ